MLDRGQAPLFNSTYRLSRKLGETHLANQHRRSKRPALRYAALVLGIMLLGSIPAWAMGVTELNIVSIATDGTEGNNHAYNPAFSDDGRYVAFDSRSTSLVSPDSSVADIFLRDTVSGTLTLISSSTADVAGNNTSTNPAMSSNGRWVAFQSSATNLVSGDTNAGYDIFLKDTQNGDLTRISTTTGGDEGNAASTNPVVSSDGRWVAFQSNASDLVSGDTNSGADVFLKDTQLGTLTRISTTTAETEGDGTSFAPAMSPNGRYVSFDSTSTNLASGDSNAVDDIFLKDIQTGTLSRVTSTFTGGFGNKDANDSRLSSDGRYVSFESAASNFVSGDANGNWDVFVKDMQTGILTRESTSASGIEGNAGSYDGALSLDGRYLAFASDSTNFVSKGALWAWITDIYIKDLTTGSIIRVSEGPYGEAGSGDSVNPVWSPDGTLLAFESRAGNLTYSDDNGRSDIFFTDFDNDAPSVAFGSGAPVSGAYIKGTVSIPATVSDVGTGLASVLVMDGSTTLATKTTGPYSFPVNTATLSNGSHSIRLRAYDEAGNQTTKTRTMKVDNYSPRTSAPSAASVAKGKAVKLYYKITDPYTSLARVTITIKNSAGNTVKTIAVGSVAANTLKYYTYTATLPKGSYRFQITANDQAGNSQYNKAKNSLTIK